MASERLMSLLAVIPPFMLIYYFLDNKKNRKREKETVSHLKDFKQMTRNSKMMCLYANGLVFLYT